jgi:Asp-tRNA(Asn)/Glu-tRNA(Gln) amidotransferase A subunit family amidase
MRNGYVYENEDKFNRGENRGCRRPTSARRRQQPQKAALTPDAALARAQSADEDLARGIDRGPLHGIPIAHKDAFFTKGVRTTAGSKILADFVPDRDADIVTRLNDAGAVVLGKTGLHELCHGITSNNPHYGAVLNPWNTERIPGGSSGGSGSAVAAAWSSSPRGPIPADRFASPRPTAAWWG